MDFFGIFRHLYLFFSKRRLALFVITSLLIAFSLFSLSRIRLSEDIKSLLPDNRGDFLLEFNLLQKTPFMHKVIINLRDRTGKNKDSLAEIADRFAKGISSSSLITDVTTGPVSNQNVDIYNFIIKSIPNLITAKDLEKIKGELNPEYIHNKLTEKYSGLFSPEGALLVEDIRADPLDLKSLILKKLASLNIIPEATLKNNHFIDKAGRNVLVIADTSVDVTDTLGAEKMLADLHW